MPLNREGGPDEISGDAARMVRALRFANYTRVAEALGVTRSAVARWARGRQVTPWNLQRVDELLGQQKEAAPDWERLMRTVDAIAERVGVSLEERAAIGDGVRAALLPLPDAETAPGPGADDRAGAGQPDGHGQ